MSRRRPPAGQMALGHADPAYEETRRIVLAEIIPEFEEWKAAEAEDRNTFHRRQYGKHDRLARARLRLAVVLGQKPDPAELAMGYRHGWLTGLEHLAPPNPARTEPVINPSIARAMEYLAETEGATP